MLTSPGPWKIGGAAGVILAMLLTLGPAFAGPCSVTPSPFWKNTIEFPDEPFRAQGTSPTNPDWVKFTILLCDPTKVYFQDSVQYPFHYDFATQHLDPLLGLSPAQFDQVTLLEAGQQAVLGAVIMPYSGGPAIPEYGIQFIRQDPYDPQMLADLFATVRSSVNADPGVQAFYFPTFEQSQSAQDNVDFLQSQGIEVSSVSRWADGNACYSEGWTLGRLKFFPADQIDSAYQAGSLQPSDILLTDGIPAEIPFVSGLISLTPSTPNSHVAILAQTFNVPFVHLAVEADAEKAQDLLGRQIVLRAYEDPEPLLPGCQARLIDVEDELDPVQIQSILDLKNLPPLNISPMANFGAYSASTDPLTPTDIQHFGGKAANFGLLRQSIPNDAPVAAAFSFDLWNAFLDQTLTGGNTLRQEISSRLAGYAYPPDFAALKLELAAIRDMFEDTATTSFSPVLQSAILTTLQDPQFGFDPFKKIRFRSSTNVEDGDQFTGAGLYDSKSGCLADDLDGDTTGPGQCDPTENNEKGVFRAIRKVFASFYYDNAFLERLRWNVDESQVGMALLVHHSFPDEIEQANGVATVERFSSGLTEMLLVTQLGAESVSNPTGGSIAEEVEVTVSAAGSTTLNLVRESNLVLLGETVMEWQADYLAMAQLLEAVADHYQAVTLETDFVLDLEYKKVAAGGGALPPGGLVVKQVRKIPQPDETPSITPFFVNEPTEFCLDQSSAFEPNLFHAEINNNHRLKSEWNVETRSFWMTTQNLAQSIYDDVEMTFTDECEVYTLDGAPAVWPQASYAFQENVPAGPTTTDSWTFDDLGNPRSYSLVTENVGPLLVSPSESPVLTLRDLGTTGPNGRGTRGCLRLQVDYQDPEPEWACDVTCAAGQTTVDEGLVCPCPVRRITDPLQERVFSFPGGVTVSASYYWPTEALGFGFFARMIEWVDVTIEGLTSEPLVIRDDFARSYDPERHGFAEDFLFEPRLDPLVPQYLLQELEASDIVQIHVNVTIFGGVSLSLMLYGADGSCTVDSNGFAVFDDCFSGAGTPPQPTAPRTAGICLALWDDDDDGDVDCNDWAQFLFRWSVPDPPPTFPQCAGFAGPGRVPETIVVGKSPILDRITVSWAPSCSMGAANYAIYEGTIGDWYSHSPMICSDVGNDFAEETVPSEGDRYYLLVPINPDDEGSYGRDSAQFERPVGSGACVSTQATTGCP